MEADPERASANAEQRGPAPSRVRDSPGGSPFRVPRL
jgi:hypothetical protein